MDDELDYQDGYFDAEMGMPPQAMDNFDYYSGYMQYQDELDDRKSELEERADEIRNEIDDLDDELDDIEDEIDEIDSEMY